MLLKKALLELTSEQTQKAAKEVTKLPEGTDDHQLASHRLDALSIDVRGLVEKTKGSDHLEPVMFPKATEQALLKALKVVLSNARSAKVGTKTALEIVAAVSGTH